MSLLETYGNLVRLTGHRARQRTLSPVRQQDVDPLPSSVALLTIKAPARGDTSTSQQMNVVLDWFEDLKRVAPTH